MTHTKLLNHLRIELKRQGVLWKKEQEFFELLLPNEEWIKFRSTWYTWKPKKDGTYTVENLSKSRHILNKISQRFYLDPSIWDEHDGVQRRAISQGVKEYLRQSDTLDISSIIPQYTLSDKQRSILANLNIIPLKYMAKELDRYPDCFQRTFVNQPFLLELINILYGKGAYELLVEKVFPNLMSHQRSNTHVKLLEAHTLGSLKEPKYMEASKLLESIEGRDTREIIDLKTSAISNLRRYYMTNLHLSSEEIKEALTIMVTTYYSIYSYKENHHYYPAINLLYALVMAEALDLEVQKIDQQEIYKQAQPSIATDKTSHNSDAIYYAHISDLEFQLLLGKQGVMRQVGVMLEQLHPPVTLINRTKRQMVLFVVMLKRLNIQPTKLLDSFKEVIELLEDYQYTN